VRLDGNGWLVSVSVEPRSTGGRLPIGVQETRDVLARSRRRQDQRCQEFFAVRPIARCFGKPNEVIKALADRCRQRKADALLRTLGEKRVGANSSPCGHVPVPDTEVVYRQEARLKHLYHTSGALA
jgi:hypothetical protein